MQRTNVKKRSQKPLGDRHAKSSAKVDQKKNTVTISKEDYDLLCDFARRALNVIEHLSGPEAIERQRIKVETMERGTFQPRVGWTYMNHLEPVVSEESSRQYERRKEIIRMGTWNASRNGWEYNGDFTGIWG